MKRFAKVRLHLRHLPQLLRARASGSPRGLGGWAAAGGLAALIPAAILVSPEPEARYHQLTVPLEPAFTQATVAGATPSLSGPRIEPWPTVLRTGVVLHADTAASGNTGNVAEVSIAANRFDPDHLLAAAMNGSTRQIWTMYSDDGGKSWSQQGIPISSDAAFHADPMAAFDSRGVAHLVHIPVVSGSPLGIEVNRSLDGGRTWSRSLRISSQREDDKTALAVDDHPDSPFRDNVYVAWKLPRGGVFFSMSSDGGGSYTPPRRISTAVISGLDLATSADGAVYLAASGLATKSVLFFRSLDGGSTFEAPHSIAPIRADGYVVTPSVCTRMSVVHASIGVDRSQGADRGDIHVAWGDYPPGAAASCPNACDTATACTTDVYISRSSDLGVTWSSPMPVHESDLGTSDQYHHWLEVDPDSGTVYVAYKDTRDASDRRSTHVYLNRSGDGGRSFESSIRLSSASSFAGNGFQYGDYQGLAVSGDRAYAAWADFRQSSGVSQIYVGRVDMGSGLEIRPSPRGFGTVQVGKTKKRKITVTNSAAENMQIEGLKITGDDATEFSLVTKGDRCSGVTLSSGRSCRLRVRFQPASVGLKEAQLVISSTADQPEVGVALEGSGAASD